MSVADDPQGRLLRRVDWRFLAGRPRPSRAFCPVPGRLRDGVALVADSLADPSALGGCDVAALRDPSAAELQAAAAALEPDGTCYVEWSRPVPGGTRAVRRRLNRAGLDDATPYWAWPPVERGASLFWLPVEAPHVVSWFLRSRRRRDGGLARLGALTREGAWRALLRLGLLPGLSVIARKPGAAAADETLPSALARLAGEEEPVARAEPAACLLLTGGHSAINKAVALVFVGSEPAPSFALKLARVAEAERALDHEASVLQAVHAHGPLAGVPRVIATRVIAGQATVAETFIEGSPLRDQLTMSSHFGFAEQVTDFLIELALHTRRGRSTRWQADIGGHAVRALPPADQPRALRVLARAGDLPMVCEQRDCSPWNLLVQPGGQLGMLDWESAERDGVPGLDLLYYLAYASFFVDGTIGTPGQRTSHAEMLRPESATGAAYQHCVARYAARVDLDPSAFDPLRLLCWLVHARGAQLRAPDSPGADAVFHLALARQELDRQDVPNRQARGCSE